MKDRHLFKAKCVDDKKWVQGFLVEGQNKVYIINTVETSCIDGENTDLYAQDWYEVIPETICQCTGLKDAKGKLIYENDICTINSLKMQDIVRYARGYWTLGSSWSFNIYFGQEKYCSISWLIENDIIKVVGNKYDERNEYSVCYAKK